MTREELAEKCPITDSEYGCLKDNINYNPRSEYYCGIEDLKICKECLKDMKTKILKFFKIILKEEN